MGKVVYVHYGHKYFIKDRFTKPFNRPFFNKPFGGLWASAVDAEYGWKQWCESNGYKDCDEHNSFKFTIKDGARKLRLVEPLDFRKVPQINKDIMSAEISLPHIDEWVYPDFEKLAKDYDYIEFEENFYTHTVLYGWDCDCILVLNPDVVERILQGA